MVSSPDSALSILEAIVLGIVQGLTEWLPVSSSGHLVLGRAALGVEVPVFFDLVLHLGTLLVVVFFYRATILDMLRSLGTLPRAFRESRSWRVAVWDDAPRRLAFLVVVGSVPTAIIAFTFEERLLALYDSTLAVGVALIGTGTLLWLTRFARERPLGGDLGWRDAVLVGAIQGLAIIPGVSRSGATIGAASLLGVEREAAVRYSFLLSIPAISGAALFQAKEAAVADLSLNAAAYAAGVLAAVIVGYGALFLLVAIVRRRAFHHFAYYCWALGAFVVWWSLSAAA